MSQHGELIIQSVLLIVPLVGSVLILAQQVGQGFDTLYPSLCGLALWRSSRRDAAAQVDCGVPLGKKVVHERVPHASVACLFETCEVKLEGKWACLRLAVGLLPVVMDAVNHVSEGEIGAELEVGWLLSCDGSDRLRLQALGGPVLGYVWIMDPCPSGVVGSGESDSRCHSSLGQGLPDRRTCKL